MSGSPDVSVIIATRNRAESLSELLHSLAGQQTDGRFTYEVIVVDNGSTDATRSAVERLHATFPVPLRYRYEGRAGKPWAVNAGIAMAQGSIFALTDDDILASPTWLAGLWRCFTEERPDAVTGKIIPHWLAPRPAWLTDQALRSVATLGCVDHGSIRRRTLDGQDCRWVGGNLAIRREAVGRIGGYDVRMTRSQDTEYYQRCLAEGLQVCYEPTAVAAHKIGAERLRPGYFRRWRRRTGFYDAQRMPWTKRDVLTVMPLWWYRAVLRLVWTWLASALARKPWLHRFRCELALHQQLGVFSGRLSLWPRRLVAVLTGRWTPDPRPGGAMTGGEA